MSTQEKSIYKQITVPSNQSQEVVAESRAYRVYKNFDPRANVDDITVSTYESGIQIECTLTYLPYNISETMQMKFDENAGFLL